MTGVTSACDYTLKCVYDHGSRDPNHCHQILRCDYTAIASSLTLPSHRFRCPPLKRPLVPLTWGAGAPVDGREKAINTRLGVTMDSGSKRGDDVVDGGDL